MTFAGIGACVIFLLMLNLSEAKNEVFCKPRRHEHYIEQFEQCKKCDRCPPGWGYGIADNKNEVEMDPVHGATSCYRCLKCVLGVSFSKVIGHKPCRQCKNCSAIGKIETRPCTTNQNAKCGGHLPPPESQKMSKDIQEEGTKQNEQKQRTSHQSNASEDLVNYKSVFLWTIVACMIIVAFFITTISMYVLRRKANKKKDVRRVEEMPLSVHSGEDNEVMMDTLLTRTSTERELEQDKGEQPTADIRNFVTHVSNTESVHSLESDFHYELKTISPLEEDGASSDGRQQISQPRVHIRESKSNGDMLTDAQVQSLTPELAACNTYRRVGRMLGVRDNDIEIIKEENRGDPKEAAFQTLKKWREVKGKEATKQRLREALRHADRQDLADKIK